MIIFRVPPKSIKQLSVSDVGEFIIPNEFREKLKIEKEVILELYNNHLIIRPIPKNFEDFSEEILAELIREGFEKHDLLSEFKNRRAQLRYAVDSLILDALKNGEPLSIDELFEDTDKA